METRLELQTRFEQILGSRNVYYQPPEDFRMKYPAIRYSLSKIDARHADDSIYKRKNVYEVILIDKNPESNFLDSILSLPYCTFDRHYASEKLNHFVFTLYY